MKRHVLILGAGFGGLELATRLSESHADAVRVTLVDRHDSFYFGFSKLDVMLGRLVPDDVRLYYRDIAKDGVEFRQETVTGIEPATRRVTTDAGSYDPDFLVVALGADYDMAATPGLAEGGSEYYARRVYAIGDVCTGPRTVPKAGIFAESAARVVADDIAATISGAEPPAP